MATINKRLWNIRLGGLHKVQAKALSSIDDSLIIETGQVGYAFEGCMIVTNCFQDYLFNWHDTCYVTQEEPTSANDNVGSRIFFDTCTKSLPKMAAMI